MDKKIIGIELSLANGSYRIGFGEEFKAEGYGVPFMCFVENDIWHVISDPERHSGSDAYIIIPRGFNPENIKLNIRNAVIDSAPLSAGNIELCLKDAHSNFRELTARRILVETARGRARLVMKPVIGVDIRAGFGDMDVILEKNDRGYSYEAVCGAGELVIDGKRIIRRCSMGDNGAVRVHIRCGLGRLCINTR